MLYENIIMSCYELIIMQTEFCTKKNSIIPDVAIKVHKKNETKESKFQCHFHLPG